MERFINSTTARPTQPSSIRMLAAVVLNHKARVINLHEILDQVRGTAGRIALLSVYETSG
jgi:hypothetical protein